MVKLCSSHRISLLYHWRTDNEEKNLSLVSLFHSFLWDKRVLNRPLFFWPEYVCWPTVIMLFFFAQTNIVNSLWLQDSNWRQKNSKTKMAFSFWKKKKKNVETISLNSAQHLQLLISLSQEEVLDLSWTPLGCGSIKELALWWELKEHCALYRIDLLFEDNEGTSQPERRCVSLMHFK